MTDAERLVEFVLAQIADDEHFWRGIGDSEHDPFIHQLAPEMLAECAAKRAIVELCVAEIDNDTDGAATALSVLYWLAQPYADRPGFDPAWKVET